ncbi:MAG TPA: GNAT family N-acetyltransferase [Jatrophihabitans sp.]|nr:GNAT family N-acetyltransferase [Jatrophihabitans sp.]
MHVAVVDAAATRPLRLAVLRPTWPADARMPGDDRPGAVHLAALDGDEVVGAGLVLAAPYPERPAVEAAWQLRGMATAPSRRSQGIGGLVLDAAVALVADRGGRLLWCGARLPAVAFYERHGFTTEGDEYVQPETGLPHVHMWRGPATTVGGSGKVSG